MPQLEFYLRRLGHEWANVNESLLRGALLSPPAFRLDESRTHLAAWVPAAREIRFSRAFIEREPWAHVVEVLKHEMAHQYVTDVLGADEHETDHGPAFRMVCRRYGIDGRATSRNDFTAEEGHLIDKIKKLLQLGTSSNENEAKSALKRAQKLLDDNGLSRRDLGDAVGDDEMGMLVLGPVFPKKPPEHHLRVAGILGTFFRVRCIWINTLDMEGRPGVQLEACGLRSDLLLAQHVHDFVLAEAQRLWAATGKANARERADFHEGVVVGFVEALRLNAQDEAAKRSGQTTALVKQLADDVGEYFDRRHPNRRAINGSRRQRGAQFGEGMEAGRRLQLNKPVAGASGPKLLGRGAS